MNFKEYEQQSMRTRREYFPREFTPAEQQLLNAALALPEEAGEFAGLIKKHIFHSHPLLIEECIKELGDQMWYMVLAADALGVDLETIARANIEKLKKRYPEGFDPVRSMNRGEEDQCHQNPTPVD